VVAGAASGAVPWVVGDAGLLVDIESDEAMAEAMDRILADPLLARRLSEAGRASCSARFSAERVAELYEAQYRAALAGRTGPGLIGAGEPAC
jgi:glycosyltransferase involved in cell wall biosynthesis